MQHAVAIWAGNFDSEEELIAYTERTLDEEQGTLSSRFMEGAGLEGLDEDFIEKHYLHDAEERRAFTVYLKHGYAEGTEFAEQLPADLDSRLTAYNSVLLLYGNDSPFGSVNDMLLHEIRTDRLSASFPLRLIAHVSYETLHR